MHLQGVSQLRILDFDLECRPLSYLSQDYTSGEVTAIAASWLAEKRVHVWLLGKHDPAEMLGGFLSLYEQADTVTGHYIRCVTPEARVLTADLRWVPAGDLVAGDSLLAFESELSGARRQMRFGTVISNRARLEEVFAVELDTGEVLHTTREHPWLTTTRAIPAVRTHWRRTDSLLGEPRISGRFHKGPALVSRILDPWRSDESWAAGWLAGFYDGEGSLDGSQNGCKGQLVAYQNSGVVHELAMKVLSEKGFPVTSRDRRGTGFCAGSVGNAILLTGGLQQKLRLLGQIRPARLLQKWQSLEPGALRTRESVGVRRVVSVGIREVAGLATSTGTYIAEGFAMHNSHDLPIVSGALLEFNLPPLTPKLTSDTYSDLVKHKYLSASQEALAGMYALERHKKHMSQPEWREANRLTKSGLAKTRQRVVSDVAQHKVLRARLIQAGALGPPRMWYP